MECRTCHHEHPKDEADEDGRPYSNPNFCIARLSEELREKDLQNGLYRSALDWILGYAHIRGLKDIEDRCNEVLTPEVKRNHEDQKA